MTDDRRQDALRIIHEKLVGGDNGKLAVAESLTAGLVQAAFGSQSGCSSYFLGGVTAYSLDAKVTVLGVPHAMAEACNCVSEEVAWKMAECALILFEEASYAIATTGYAEPDLSREVHIPFAHYAIMYPSTIVPGRTGVHLGMVRGPGLNRQEMREMVTTHVLCELAALCGVPDEFT